jgi:hypothetical protein
MTSASATIVQFWEAGRRGRFADDRPRHWMLSEPIGDAAAGEQRVGDRDSPLTVYDPGLSASPSTKMRITSRR